ncbi:MAG TPA: CDP-alcohol phosphatidyltransferase family protein [Bryobacteraceae bacterium]|nr:CDP-alcohol phosphatidyltransferase family protein [Bryobacteraceae bacterium]
MRWLPNALTFFRLGSSPILVWLLLQHRYREALALTLVAGLTDWFDGYAARRLGAGGKVGVLFDPLADKALLLTLFVVLGVLRLIPLWMLGLAIGRDLIIVGGAFLIRIFRGKQRFVPSTLGKVSTFFQIMLVLLVLLVAAFPYQLFQWLSYLALLLAALFTVLSGLDYIRLGMRIALRRIDGTPGGE